MTERTAQLHAGLLARKGQARPATHSTFELGEPELEYAANSPRIDFDVRRGPVVENAEPEPSSARVIELPRRTIPKKVAQILQKRHQIHARVSPDIHIRLKMTAAQLERTQQDLVASAIDAYLSFIDNDVRPLVSGGTNATD